MITLGQIQDLEKKVRKAVQKIRELRDENDSLRTRLNGYEDKILNLEEMIENFKGDQQEIENGIVNAIKQLDELEEKHNMEGGFENSESPVQQREQDVRSNMHESQENQEEITSENTENKNQMDTDEVPASSNNEELDIF